MLTRKRARTIGPPLILICIGVAMPLYAAHHHGALGIPRGDDWSYLRALFHWVDTGHLSFNHWVSMMLVGQLAIAAPLAAIWPNNITVLQVLVSLGGAIGLLAVYNTAQVITHRRGPSLLAALCVAASPFWGVLSVGFMTDVPTFALVAVTIWVAVRCVQVENLKVNKSITVIALGVAAFSIREYGIIFATAATIIMLQLHRRADRASGSTRSDTRKVFIAALCAIALVGFGALLWRTIPDSKALTPRFPDGHAVRTLFYKGSGILRLIGLVLTPLVLYCGPRSLTQRAFQASKDTPAFIAAFTIFGLAFSGTSGPRIAFAGNYVSPDGALANSVGAGIRPDLISGPFWNGLIVIGSFSAVVLVLAMFAVCQDHTAAWRTKSIPDLDPTATMLLLAILGYAGTYTIASLLGLPLYDRYALPMTALVALLILHVTQQPRSKAHTERGRPHLMTAITAIASVGALASLIALGSIYTFDSASYDGARWLTATDAVEQGYNARDIGGSFEWVNYFAQQPGTGVRKRGHFCIKVLLLPAHAKNPAIISRRVYRPPFRDPVIVAAVRQPTRCMHGEPLPTRAAP